MLNRVVVAPFHACRLLAHPGWLCHLHYSEELERDNTANFAAPAAALRPSVRTAASIGGRSASDCVG